jgi:hypothetical protein
MLRLGSQVREPRVGGGNHSEARGKKWELVKVAPPA